ncbi:MAG: hypothetical protein ABSB22_15710 [Thermodesulfobacteriota bacterium]|jgi:hypothetical protein
MKKKPSDAAITAEALDFFKSIREQSPDGNELVIEILDKLYKDLHEKLLGDVLQKSKGQNMNPLGRRNEARRQRVTSGGKENKAGEQGEGEE